METYATSRASVRVCVIHRHWTITTTTNYGSTGSRVEQCRPNVRDRFSVFDCQSFWFVSCCVLSYHFGKSLFALEYTAANQTHTHTNILRRTPRASAVITPLASLVHVSPCGVFPHTHTPRQQHQQRRHNNW